MRADINPEYRPVVFLDATTGKKSCQLLLQHQTIRLNLKVKNTQLSVWISHQTHTHSTQVSKSLHKPMVRSTSSTRSLLDLVSRTTKTSNCSDKSVHFGERFYFLKHKKRKVSGAIMTDWLG